MSPKELIRWKALSRFLANNHTISATRCPKKYEADVNDLLEAIEAWAEKIKEKASTPETSIDTET